MSEIRSEQIKDGSVTTDDIANGTLKNDDLATNAAIAQSKIDSTTGWITSLIETTTNSDGTYLKFDNGTLICYFTKNSTNGNYNTWTFPYTFISAPMGFATQNTGEGNGLYVTIGTIGTTSYRFGLIVGNTGNYYAGTLPCALMAIGRWKS
jgi:hypothetical protein